MKTDPSLAQHQRSCRSAAGPGRQRRRRRRAVNLGAPACSKPSCGPVQTTMGLPIVFSLAALGLSENLGWPGTLAPHASAGVSGGISRAAFRASRTARGIGDRLVQS